MSNHVFKEKRPHVKSTFPKQTHDKRKEETNVERWGIPNVKGGRGREIKGICHTKVATWHEQHVKMIP